MATVWKRFSQFVKGASDQELDLYQDEAPSSRSEEPAFYLSLPRSATDQPLPGSPSRPGSNPVGVPPPSYRVPAEIEANSYDNLPEIPPPTSVNSSLKPSTPTRTGDLEDEGTEMQETKSAQAGRGRTGVSNTEFSEQVFSPESTNLTIPYWLADEDTLRDEGVLFGLSESEPTEKTDIIHNYFQHLAANHERHIEQQNERVQELNLFIGQKENRIQELKAKLKNLENAQPEGEHQLPRTLVGLLLSIAMCVGNYYLIEETLRPAFASSSFVALGVFLAGMFNLFGRISLFHDTESAVSWRRLLEEVGMPLAAALFVFAQALQTQSWWQAAALFVFVFFLFLFAGKLFLSNITVLRNDLRVWLTSQRRRRESVSHAQLWEEETVQLDQEINDFRVQKWQVLREQGTSESQLTRLHARRDMLIKLFESEFYLARNMKGRLSEKQLREIRGE
jgi:hypothetical protein